FQATQVFHDARHCEGRVDLSHGSRHLRQVPCVELRGRYSVERIREGLELLKEDRAPALVQIDKASDTCFCFSVCCSVVPPMIFVFFPQPISECAVVLLELPWFSNLTATHRRQERKMRGEVDAAFPTVARPLNVDNIDSTALDAPESRPTPLEAVGPKHG